MNSPHDSLEPSLPRKTYDSSVWLWIIPLLLIGIFLLIFLFLSYPALKHTFRRFFKSRTLFKRKRKNANERSMLPLSPIATQSGSLDHNPYTPLPESIFADAHSSVIDIRSLEQQRPASTPLPAYKDIFPSPLHPSIRFSRSACHSPDV